MATTRVVGRPPIQASRSGCARGSGYVLTEAEAAAGQEARPGRRVVDEVRLGILTQVPLPYLNVQPNWRPAAPLARAGGTFDRAALIRSAMQP